jgi:Skp family chaperone for outer membrane proteins
MMPALRSLPLALTFGALFSSLASGQTPALPSKAAFPADARIAFVNLQYVFATSREGKAAATELQALQDKKKADIAAKTKEVQALEQKLTQGVTLLNDEARGKLERDVARVKVDFERLVQDSQAEVEERQQQFQRAFSRRLFPAIGEVAKERNLWAVFRLDQESLIWHSSALDISNEIVTRLDGAR